MGRILIALSVLALAIALGGVNGKAEADVPIDPVIWQFGKDYPGTLSNDASIPVRAVYVKTHDEATWMSRYDHHPMAISDPAKLRRVVQMYGNRDIEVVAWFVPKGRNIEAQLSIAKQVIDSGVKGLIADVEPYQGFCNADCQFLADHLWKRLRAERPDAFLGVIYDPRPAHWRKSGLQSWLSVSDAALPMCYWETFRGQGQWGDPAGCVRQAHSDLTRLVPGRSLQYVPMIQGDSTGPKVLQAIDAAESVGAEGVSIWRRGVVPADVWSALAGGPVSTPATPRGAPVAQPTNIFLYDGKSDAGKARGVVLLPDGSGNWRSSPPNHTFDAGWKVYPGNFNNDPRTDLFLYDGNGGPGNARGVVLFAQKDGDWRSGPVHAGLDANWRVFPGDFNGNGLTDIFLYDGNGGPGKARGVVLFADGKGGWKSGPIYENMDANWSVYTGDFNGNSRTDLFLYDGHGGPGKARGMVLFSNGKGGWKSGPVHTGIDANWKVHTGDFNGNQLTDLFLYDGRASSGKARSVVLFADGKGYWKSAPTNTSIDAGWKVFPGDFSGDGFTDLFLYDGRGGQGKARSVVLFADGHGGWKSSKPNTSIDANWKVFPGDFSGDGFTDLFLYDGRGGQGKARSVVLFADGRGGWKSSQTNTSIDASWKVFPLSLQ